VTTHIKLKLTAFFTMLALVALPAADAFAHTGWG